MNKKTNFSTDKKYVRLTRNLIGKIFDECNTLYFDNQIEKPYKFELWIPWKRCVGWVRASCPGKVGRAQRANGIKPHTYFHINGRYNWTRENLKKVIIHEMIHLYIKDYLRPLNFWQRRFPFLVKQHDREFKEVMNRLNLEYGLDIATRAAFMKKELKK